MVCRLKCSYDPTCTTNGGCPSGYTYSPRSEACVEACVNDQQCNFIFGLSRSEGLVTAFRNDQVCNPISGGCEPQTPSTAKLNDPCVYHTDCPAPGLCISGFCGSIHCAGVNPAPCDGTCLAFGGSGSGSATVCVAPCDTVEDCAVGQICVSPNTTADPSPGYCLGACNQDDECRPEERCLAPYGVEPDPLVMSPGQCTAICPLPGDVSPPEATPCGSNEACVPLEGQTYGRCKVLDALCLGDAFCAPSQACEVLVEPVGLVECEIRQAIASLARSETDVVAALRRGRATPPAVTWPRRSRSTELTGAISTDLRGRCVNGCTVDGDCAVATDVCVIQPGSLVGVCRSPGGVCSASPLIGGDTPLQPLLGDAQCVPGEQCAQVQATVPRTPSTCM